MAKLSAVIPTNPAADAGRFVNSEGMHDLMGRALRIVDIREDNTNRFGARWLVSVVDLGTGEKIALGLKRNPARDSILPAVKAVLDDEGADGIDPVCLTRETPEKGGNSFWTFRDAADSEIEAAEAEAADDVDEGEPDEMPGETLKAARRRNR